MQRLGAGRDCFYYSVGPQSKKHPSRIGAAVGEYPQGPFIDSGKPLLTGGDGFEAIDPMAFTDPNTGISYLYAGGSAGAKLRVFELNEDMVSFAREIPVENPPNFTEGAFMHYANGVYYLSYSHGSYKDASYSVHYVTSQTPVGPWTYHGAILVSDAAHKGPGHHCFVQKTASAQWLIFYHRWNNREGNGPFRGKRQIAAERVEYDGQGLIKPIRMTDVQIALEP
ncbi:MAG: family 43 glycosylhydrolase [Planctomycetaceae bacterium]|nr:family 43 glycosylhydrolase [Planctomycetaceae bacterium]